MNRDSATIVIGKDLHRELRVASDALGPSIRDIVTDACREWLRSRVVTIRDVASARIPSVQKGSRA